MRRLEGESCVYFENGLSISLYIGRDKFGVWKVCLGRKSWEYKARIEAEKAALEMLGRQILQNYSIVVDYLINKFVWLKFKPFEGVKTVRGYRSGSYYVFSSSFHVVIIKKRKGYEVCAVKCLGHYEKECIMSAVVDSIEAGKEWGDKFIRFWISMCIVGVFNRGTEYQDGLYKRWKKKVLKRMH